jgi:hypothetical protein
MKLFDDELIEEYQQWKKANPNSFNWWSYVNLKADLQTALAFAKFFSPELIEIDGCLILKDRYDEVLFHDWKKACGNDKTSIEKMMNLYELNDFFHINVNEMEDDEEQVKVLGDVLKHYWSMAFKQGYPNRNIIIDVFMEYDGQLFITVYENL